MWDDVRRCESVWVSGSQWESVPLALKQIRAFTRQRLSHGYWASSTSQWLVLFNWKEKSFDRKFDCGHHKLSHTKFDTMAKHSALKLKRFLQIWPSMRNSYWKQRLSTRPTEANMVTINDTNRRLVAMSRTASSSGSSILIVPRCTYTWNSFKASFSYKRSSTMYWLSEYILHSTMRCSNQDELFLADFVKNHLIAVWGVDQNLVIRLRVAL